VTTLILIVGAWLLVSVVLGLALARLFGGISPGTAAPSEREQREEHDRLARPA
jgi:hypothetical protein